MSFIYLILQSILVPLISPLVIGIIKKIKARLQNRRGASPLQPYRDLWKLLHKDEIISKDASWIFRVAPFIVFGVTIAVGVSIPLFTSFSTILTSDALVMVK